jgi:hypothetical protein
MRSIALALFGLLLLSPACSNIPTAPPGDRIVGTVHYQGSAHAALSRPALQIFAAVQFPLEPTQIPHGLLVIENPDLQNGVGYELTYVPIYRYKVGAQLIDLAHPDADPSTLPLGGYPDMCTFALVPDGGLVEVQNDVAATGIDIELYDLGGMTDPCFAMP